MQPFAEQVAHLERQAQQHVARLLDAGAAAASRMRSISASLIAGMIGATITAVGTPAADKLPHRLEPRAGRRRARLHRARELGIERGHRQRDLGEVALGHARQDVDVAQ